jgi:hypothetical protein
MKKKRLKEIGRMIKDKEKIEVKSKIRQNGQKYRCRSYMRKG